MLDTDIHNGLNDKEVRDFLSVQINQNVVSDFLPHEYPQGQDSWVTSLNNAKIDFENAKKEIIRHEKMIGIRRILKSMNWEDHDCSDHVGRTGDHLCRNFIGTHEEFKKFMKENFNVDITDDE